MRAPLIGRLTEEVEHHAVDRIWNCIFRKCCLGYLFQLKKTAEDLNEALATKEEIAQRCRELDMQVGRTDMPP